MKFEKIKRMADYLRWLAGMFHNKHAPGDIPWIGCESFPCDNIRKTLDREDLAIATKKQEE